MNNAKAQDPNVSKPGMIASKSIYRKCDQERCTRYLAVLIRKEKHQKISLNSNTFLSYSIN